MKTILTPLEGHQHVWHSEQAALPPADGDDNKSVWCVVESPSLTTEGNPKGYGVAYYSSAVDIWVAGNGEIIDVELWKVIQPSGTPLEYQVA